MASAAAHADDSRLGFGKMEFGCIHYRRRCKIRAPCCNEIFNCRHCHNETARHELCRQDVQQVICLVCDTEQPVGQVCSNCGINMGEYYCDVCKFYDDDVEKGQYHCNDCGICRVGGRENFFHCKKCGSCYSTELRNKHFCIENSMRHNCPICYEYLFDSLKETRVLNCGHTLHMDCYREMLTHNKYSCPVCSKSVCDMSNYWRKLDEEIATTIMPDEYRYKDAYGVSIDSLPVQIPVHCTGYSRVRLPIYINGQNHIRVLVWILCNDCNNVSEVLFHIVGHKCNHCKSFNTRTISTPPVPTL